eukprot:2958803-Rhodomonas_salina.4
MLLPLAEAGKGSSSSATRTVRSKVSLSSYALSAVPCWGCSTWCASPSTSRRASGPLPEIDPE